MYARVAVALLGLVACADLDPKAPDFVAEGYRIFTHGLPVTPNDIHVLSQTLDTRVAETFPLIYTPERLQMLHLFSLSIHFRSAPWECIPGQLCSGFFTGESIVVVYDACMASSSLVHEFIHFYRAYSEKDPDGAHLNPAWFTSACVAADTACTRGSIEWRTRNLATAILCGL